jgi:translocation and assembly module TamA
VRQDAGPARSLSANAGFSTGEGLRIEGAWEHRNFWKPEGAIRASAIVGTKEQAVRLQFRRSNAGKRDRTVLVQAEAGRRDFAAFRGYTARLHGLISRESTPIWHKRWTWAYGAEIIATNESVIGEPRLSIGDAFFLAGVTGQLGYDTSNSLLDPTKGFRLLGRVIPRPRFASPASLISATSSKAAPIIRRRTTSRSRAGAARLDLWCDAGRTGAVSAALFRRRRLGARLRVSGARPAYRGAEPQIRPGGSGREGRSDPLRADRRTQSQRVRCGRPLPLRNYGIVAFVDAGQVYESQTPGLNDLRFGVGVGGRFYTNFGPFRADIAMPLDRRKGESRFAVYVSIGQAF